MTITHTMARTAPLALTVALTAGASMAAARPQAARLSDSEYIAMARCEGLMTSAALGKQDTREIEARLKAQSVSRSNDALDRADDARDDAHRLADHAGAYAKAALIAERDGACRALGGSGTMSAAVAPAGGTRTN